MDHKSYYCNKCGCKLYDPQHDCDPSIETKIDNILTIIIELSEKLESN